MVSATLSAWPDTTGWDWRLSRRTLAGWVVGALSGWIGHRWANSKCSCDFVNNRMRRLRAPSATHCWVHSRLITKANEWRTWGEEAYQKKAEPLLHYLTGHLSSIAPLNEPRPRVNMPLGCQSIPVTCNTNTQKPAFIQNQCPFSPSLYCFGPIVLICSEELNSPCMTDYGQMIW